MKVLLLTLLSIAASSTYAGQTEDRQRAFNDGKSYKSRNWYSKNSINNSSASQVPGQNPAATSTQQGNFGQNQNQSGVNKVNQCATYTPGSNAYQNQECETINYVVGNPAQNQTYPIDRKSDPLIVKSKTISNTPNNYTQGMAGLSGNYSACTDSTSKLPEQSSSERCEIGNDVTEGQCQALLKVTVNWQYFANQPTANMNYARCESSQLIPGDLLNLALWNIYQGEPSSCADRGMGTGTYYTFVYTNCAGVKVEHGYDSSQCSNPADPAILDPQRVPINFCADAPRIHENCFTSEGKFTSKIQVPVFVDTWDFSACAELNANEAVIED